MINWIKVRIDILKRPDRRIEVARTHLGHVGTGFSIAALTGLLGAPGEMTLAAAAIWTLAAETHDSIKYSGKSLLSFKRFPIPLISWSNDSRWDAFQIMGGAGIVPIILWGLTLPVLPLYLLAWFGVYFWFLPRM